MSETPTAEVVENDELRTDYSDAEREKMAKSGEALPDGSYPIKTVGDLKNAIQAYGRAKDKGAAKAHIKKRAKALGRTDLIPEDWRSADEGLESRDMSECECCPDCGPECDGGCCGDCAVGTAEPGGQPGQNAATPELEVRRRHALEREGTVERRSIESFELRDTSDGLVRFTGYASTTEHPYTITDMAGEFEETIARGAFKRTLGESPDVFFNINHGTGGSTLPIARTKSGTMTLTEDSRGLRVDADLDPNDPDVRALVPKMRRGDVDQMSFAFRATAQEWNEDYTTRLIRECMLHRGDVSIVTQGANPDTSACIRSADGELEVRVGKPISAAREAVIKEAIDHLTTGVDHVGQATEKLDGIIATTDSDIEAEPGEDLGSTQGDYKITLVPQRSYMADATAKELSLLLGVKR